MPAASPGIYQALGMHLESTLVLLELMPADSVAITGSEPMVEIVEADHQQWPYPSVTSFDGRWSVVWITCSIPVQHWCQGNALVAIRCGNIWGAGISMCAPGLIKLNCQF